MVEKDFRHPTPVCKICGTKESVVWFSWAGIALCDNCFNKTDSAGIARLQIMEGEVVDGTNGNGT